MAQQQQSIVADSRVGFQQNKAGGGILRSRVPTDIIEALGAGDGNYIRWETQTDGKMTWVIGYAIDASDAKPRDIIAERQAASKGGAKKAAKKAGAKKSRKADPLADAFGGDEDEEAGQLPAPPRRTAPALPTRRVAVTPARPAARQAAPTPAPSRPVRGPLLKPSQRKKAGPVRYETPDE